ncbi:MAG: ThiF family adenylyltransferase [Spirochaetales bacterium]|nr:ThiF family adenylyltransferase [Spirochaetales bacterium]
MQPSTTDRPLRGGITPRYSRHRSLLSDAAWERMCAAHIVVAGAGGLGSHLLQGLSRLGALRIEIWDPALLDEPDLNRQVLYGAGDVGRPKVLVAAERLRAINPQLEVTAVQDAVPTDAVGVPLGDVHRSEVVVFDCLDSFSAREGLDALHRRIGCPVFHGGVEGWYGQVTTLLPGRGGYGHVFGPEYAAIPGGPKPILVHTVAAVAAFQTGEFLHWCADPRETPLSSSLLLYDGKTMRADQVRLA